MDTGETSSKWKGIVRGNILMLGLVSFATDLSSEMVYPLLPVFFTGLVSAGMVPLYVGVMDGVADTVSSILKIYSGRLSDSLGVRKPLAVAGYSISTVSRSLTALAGAGWHVVGFRTADRVGKGVRTAPRDALLSSAVESRHLGVAFSFHRMMDHGGAVLGPLVGAAILYGFLGHQLWGLEEAAATPPEMNALRWLFLFSIIPGLVAVLILGLGVKEKRPDSVLSSDAESTVTENDSVADDSGKLSRSFYWYLGTVAIFTFGNSSDLFLILYLKTELHLGVAHMLGLWVLLHIVKIVFSMPGGMLADSLGRRWAIVLGWLVYAGVYAGFAIGVSLPVLVGLLAVYGIYYGLCEGAERALVAEQVPHANRGKAYGIFHAVVGLTTLPANILFGIWWKFFGADAAFLIGAGLAITATVLLIIAPRPEAE